MNDTKPDLLVQIYYGTAGNNGLYMDQTIKAIEDLDIDKIAYVEYYYLFDTQGAKKVFFKHSDNMRRTKLRKYVKYLELYANYRHIAYDLNKLSKRYNRIYLIYSLNESYKLSYEFLKDIKRIKNIRLGAIVHDVIPFGTIYNRFIYVNQSEILKLMDFFISHNKYTEEVLRQQGYNQRIYTYRFPLLDLKKLNSQKETVAQKYGDHTIVFLFLGFLRKEKGIDILLDAWKNVEVEGLNAKLIIAGKIPEGISYNFDGFNSVTVLDRYLDDDEYKSLIEQCDYGVIPYTEGTNSGILSSISSMLKPCITSDIRMFKESFFSIEDLRVPQNDSQALYETIKKCVKRYDEDYSSHVDYLTKRISEYDQAFAREAYTAYYRIITTD